VRTRACVLALASCPSLHSCFAAFPLAYYCSLRSRAGPRSPFAGGKKLDFVVGPRREGDAARVYADASKAKALLGWAAERSLEDMCADSWRWCSTNPRGYDST
jgi:hypothetical protein